MSQVSKNPACEFSAAFRAKLQRLVDDTPGFEDPDFQVSGADLIAWFGEFRQETKDLLAKPPTNRLTDALKELIEVAGQSVELSDWPELQKALEEGWAALSDVGAA